nr:MAG TPA: hypothetical protein [Microviridae sp.]
MLALSRAWDALTRLPKRFAIAPEVEVSVSPLAPLEVTPEAVAPLPTAAPLPFIAESTGLRPAAIKSRTSRWWAVLDIISCQERFFAASSALYCIAFAFC